MYLSIFKTTVIINMLLGEAEDMDEKKALVLLGLIYVLTFAYYYPSFYGISDEQSYLRSAYLLRDGKLSVADPLHRNFFVPNGKEYVSIYPPGQSLLLLPFTFFGWRATFISGLLMHLLGVFVFYLVLKRIGLRVEGTALYLLYPPFLFNSRTIMSDLSSGVIILIAFYFYIGTKKRSHYLSGLFFGLAFIFRYTNVIAFIPFLIVSFLKNREKFFRLVLAFLPFGIFILGYNKALFGGYLTTGYKISGVEDLSLARIPLTALKYVLLLSVVYPLMFISPFLYKKEYRLEISSTLLLFLLFYSSYVWAPFDLKPTTLIGGVRFFIPIIPLLLLTYVPIYFGVLEKTKLKSSIPLILTVALLLSGMLIIFSLHQDYLNQRYAVFNEIGAKTPENSLVIGIAEDFMYLGEQFDKRGYASVGTPELTRHILENDSYILLSYYNKDVEEYKDLERLVGEHDTELVGSTSEPYKTELYHIKNQ